MDYQKETKATFDEYWSTKYRQGDEQAVEHGSRKHYCGRLQDLSGSFKDKTTILDIGCGTGRYFHCLRNVKQLVGIDISQHMLDQARNPVKKETLDVAATDLLCGDIYSLDLSSYSFDLIYSIGVLGEYSPLNLKLLDKLFELLNSDGKLFITAVDIQSRMQMPENLRPTIGRRIVRKAFPWLPLSARELVNRLLSSFYLTKVDLEKLLKESSFSNYVITRYQNPAGWQGAHFDCIAYRS